MSMISAKLRNSARGEACTFNIPGVCTGSVESVVLCHAPSEAKGMGMKSPDFWAAFGCHACHEHLDLRCVACDIERFYWLRGIFRTWQRWIELRLVILPVDPTTAKKRPRKKANLPSRKIRSRGFPKARARGE